MPKLNLAQIFSLFIALLMVSSIASYMLIGRGAEQQQQNIPEQEAPKVQPKIEIYDAEVDANVVELFPSIFLVAKTEEAEKEVIDNAVLQLGKISQFNSYYVAEDKQPKIMKSLTYAANIVLAEDENIIAFTERVRDLNIFSHVELYRIALAKLPKEINYVKEEDKNVTRKHSLEEPFVNIYASMLTLKGDVVKVSLKAYFADGQLFKQIGFEVENISAKPKFLSAESEAKIVELYNRLDVSGSSIYRQKNYNKIKEELEKIEKVEKVKFYLQPISYRIYVNFDDENFLKEHMQDINNALKDANLNFKLSAYSLRIDFDENTNYSELKDKIKNALQKFEANYTLDEPNVYVRADVNLSEFDSSVVESIQEVFGKYDLNAAVKRLALVDLNINKLVDKQTKQEFMLEKRQKAWVDAKRNIDEEVKVEIQAIGQRKEISYIEVREPTS